MITYQILIIRMMGQGKPYHTEYYMEQREP